MLAVAIATWLGWRVGTYSYYIHIYYVYMYIVAVCPGTLQPNTSSNG